MVDGEVELGAHLVGNNNLHVLHRLGNEGVIDILVAVLTEEFRALTDDGGGDCPYRPLMLSCLPEVQPLVACPLPYYLPKLLK